MIVRCLRGGLSTNLSVMTEWTLEAVKAEIDYRTDNAKCNWVRANRRAAPSWFARVIHRTPAKPDGTKA